jgi:hypothetical protein
MLTPFIIAATIDIIVNLIAQIIILYSFYSNFKFFRDKYIRNAGYSSMPTKLKLLTYWIIFIVIQNMFEFVYRMLSRTLTIYGLENLN